MTRTEAENREREPDVTACSVCGSTDDSVKVVAVAVTKGSQDVLPRCGDHR